MIYWKSDTPSEIGTPTVVPEKEMVINGLENYSKYTVRVLAYNTAGDGPYSPPLFGRTKQWSMCCFQFFQFLRKSLYLYSSTSHLIHIKLNGFPASL